MLEADAPERRANQNLLHILSKIGCGGNDALLPFRHSFFRSGLPEFIRIGGRRYVENVMFASQKL